jgi:hypothetical protein
MKKMKALEDIEKKEIPQEQQLVDELARIAGSLAKSLAQIRQTLVSRDGWSAARAACGSLSTDLRALSVIEGAVGMLDQLLSQGADREFLELEANLREQFAKLGWKLDGHWPKLFIERAIPLEFFEKDRTAFVGVSRIEHPSVSLIVSMVRPIIQSLIPKNFSASAFFTKLGEAYDKVRSGSPQVPILDVYRCYVLSLQKPKFWQDARDGAFVSLSIDQFRARLSRALEEIAAGSSPGRGQDLRLLPPLDPKDALFVYQPSETRFGFVGRIEFVSKEHE